jgi:hypothetical protein
VFPFIAGTGGAGRWPDGEDEEEEEEAEEGCDAVSETPTYESLAFDQNGPGQWEAFFQNPRASLRARSLGQAAIEATRDRFIFGPMHNNEADAFRHAYWSYTMTEVFGAQLAQAFGDAYEISNPNPEGERLMDLYNNSVGRALAEAGDGPADSTIGNALDQGCLQTEPF